MNSFVRCLVMLTYTLVVYKLDNGLIVGYNDWCNVNGMTEKYITKEFCEKRVVEAKKLYAERPDDYCNERNDTGYQVKYKYLGAMCVPSKDL